MNFKQFRFALVYFFILLALVVSFQGIAQAELIPRCKAMKPECFSPNKLPAHLSPDGFKVPDNNIPKFSGDERVPSTKKPFCAGSNCPPSNAEELSKKITGDTRSKVFVK